MLRLIKASQSHLASIRFKRFKPNQLFQEPTHLFKHFSKSMASNSGHWKSKEIQIPLSFGHIAAKAWGDENAPPVLALHGWQDNAGTFDNLIPMLSSNLYIVAMDCLGHGLSSHKPIGSFYHFMEMLVDIKRVVDYLKWEKFSFLAHSMGGTLAILYSGIYSENIRNVVLLDVLKPASRSFEKLPAVTKNGIDSLLKTESKMKNPIPVYTLDEARTRLVSGMYNEITLQSADILLKRGTKPSDCGNGVVFSRDIRVKGTEELQKLSHEDLKAYLSQLQCNLLIIRGKESIIFKSRTPEVLDDFIDLYKRTCKSFKVVEVLGNHFVHLNNAELVAPHIDAFFKMYETDKARL